MFDDLSNFFAPQQPTAPAAPDPGLKAEWDGFLQNPKNRAAVLSFGLGLMTPTWGNSFANAIGGAAESYGAVEKMEQDEAIRQENVGRALSEKEKDRQLTRDMNKEDNQAAMARTKYSSDAATSRAGLRGTAYSKGAQSLFNRTYAAELKRVKEPDILSPGYNPDAPPISDEEADQLATAAAVRAADAFDARFGTGGGTAGANAGASNSQISAPAAGQGGNGPAAEGPPAANVGATNNSTKPQAAAPATPTITAEALVEKYSPQQLQTFLARPDTETALSKYGLNSAMVRAAAARKQARNWLTGLVPGSTATPQAAPAGRFGVPQK